MLKPVWWDDGKVHFINQLQLPHDEEIVVATTADQVHDAIRDMIVRGAPAIGISAAYGYVLAALHNDGPADFEAQLDRLAVARPTAVNLLHGLKFMRNTHEKMLRNGAKQEKLGELLLAEAMGYHEADIAMNLSIGDRGTELMIGEEPRPLKIITYCNTGSLATGGHGTALGVIKSLHKTGAIDVVYACETRPFLQGARLTAYELSKDAIPYKLISDNMASWLMQTENIDAVIVGADRIAANGDTANKIGTLGLALSARYFDVPFYVAAPSSTIDLATATGIDIPVEQRNVNEVLGYRDIQWAPKDAEAWNPAFDVTPADLITAIITEKAIVIPTQGPIPPELVD